jgi:XTP/dITP diphosphohydrolase
MQQIVLASHNAAKIKEFQHFFSALDIKIIPQAELKVEEVEEPFATFIENALLKARHASQLTGLPALADDSGLCVAALQGAPGVRSARYGGEPKSDARNNAQLLQALAEHENRRAYYYAVLVFIRHAQDPQPIIAEGRCDGEILSTIRGEGGFGYDPLFWLPLLGRSMAELSFEEKSKISHRGQALHVLRNKLGADYG